MLRTCNARVELSARWAALIRNYSRGESMKDDFERSKILCKIMMSATAVTLDTALTQSGVVISPEVVEDVLKRFQNAGMTAYRFFDWAGKQRRYEHNTRVYHLIVEALAKIRQYQLMWDVVNKMRSKRMLNVETFCIIMRKYARARKVKEAVFTFNQMDKFGVDRNLAAFNGLLSALCKSKNVSTAQDIFDEMKSGFIPDSKTYSILIEGWGRAPNLPKARQVFTDMVDAGCDVDVVTYSIMVDVLCKAGKVDEAVGIVNEMHRNVCRPTSFVYSVLIHTYGVENRIEDAIRAFLEMEKNGIKADVVVYNALVGAFCKANKFKNVYRVLKEMDRKSVLPNSRTCNIILNAMIANGEKDEAFKVFRKMITVCDPDADTYTIVTKMFCDKGDIEMALKVWKYMKLKGFVPSMHTFSVLIHGLCDMGDAARGCVLLEDMIEKGMRPSGTTFVRLRRLLVKEGREDVLKFLHEKINVLVQEPLWDSGTSHLQN